MLRAKPNLQRNAPCAGADYLGLTIETVSRTLSHLKSDALIRQIFLSEIELTNLDALREITES